MLVEQLLGDTRIGFGGRLDGVVPVGVLGVVDGAVHADHLPLLQPLRHLLLLALILYGLESLLQRVKLGLQLLNFTPGLLVEFLCLSVYLVDQSLKLFVFLSRRILSSFSDLKFRSVDYSVLYQVFLNEALHEPLHDSLGAGTIGALSHILRLRNYTLQRRRCLHLLIPRLYPPLLRQLLFVFFEF